MGASVIEIGVYRRRRDGEPSIEDARILVEQFISALHLAPAVADHISKELGVILLAVDDGNIDAVRAWKRILREIRAPIRAREPGELGCQPMIDRVVVVVALAAHYRMMR
jgi:hypothetical protein